MVKALHRKLWRDFWQLRGQTLAIALVVIGGIATLVMALTNHEALTQTRDRFYGEHRFADVFANLRRAPLPLLEEIRALPGVRVAEGRVIRGVNLDLPGYRGATNALAVSLPPDPDNGLNRLFLRSGRLPQGYTEAVIGEAFAEVHGLHAGDSITAILNGKRQTLHISGIGLSPEYVYAIRPGDMFPDYERFTVMWMQREALALAFDLDGAFNQLAVGLEPGAMSAEVVDGIDRLLRPYGGGGAYDRELQLSHRLLSEELKQLQTSARLFSVIFLGVTAFLLHVVIGRLIGTQREQIAVLKAFGYTRWEIGAHYLQLVLLMVSVGILPGIGLGAWLGHGLAQLYMRFYRFPFLEWSVTPSTWGLSVVFALGAAMLGALGGLWRAFRLAPAEAMRPEAPAVFRRTLSERLGLGALLDPAARMVLRNLERHPWRSALSILGMGMACGILVMSRLQSSSIDEIVSTQFGLALRDDLSVALIEPTSWRVTQELAALPGVLAVEPYRSTAVKLRNGHKTYTTSLQGFAAQGDLKRVLDDRLRPIALPEQGLLLTDYLADMLDIRPGQVLTVEFLDGRRDTLELPVTATVTEYLGVGVYARREWLNRLLQEGDVVNGAWLKVRSDYQADVLQTLRDRPRVAGVSDRRAAINSFYDTMAENMLMFTLVMTFMASSIAVGVVYNAARITLAERARDLASLRILGYTQAEVRNLLLGELGTLSLSALLPGFALGYGMGAWLVSNIRSDLYRVPLVLSPQAFALAGGVLLASAIFSAWLVVRRLRHMDLIAVLKTRE